MAVDIAVTVSTPSLHGDLPHYGKLRIFINRRYALFSITHILSLSKCLQNWFTETRHFFSSRRSSLIVSVILHLEWFFFHGLKAHKVRILTSIGIQIDHYSRDFHAPIPLLSETEQWSSSFLLSTTLPRGISLWIKFRLNKFSSWIFIWLSQYFIESNFIDIQHPVQWDTLAFSSFK